MLCKGNANGLFIERAFSLSKKFTKKQMYFGPTMQMFFFIISFFFLAVGTWMSYLTDKHHFVYGLAIKYSEYLLTW